MIPRVRPAVVVRSCPSGAIAAGSPVQGAHIIRSFLEQVVLVCGHRSTAHTDRTRDRAVRPPGGSARWAREGIVTPGIAGRVHRPGAVSARQHRVGSLRCVGPWAVGARRERHDGGSGDHPRASPDSSSAGSALRRARALSSPRSPSFRTGWSSAIRPSRRRRERRRASGGPAARRQAGSDPAPRERLPPRPQRRHLHRGRASRPQLHGRSGPRGPADREAGAAAGSVEGSRAHTARRVSARLRRGATRSTRICPDATICASSSSFSRRASLPVRES